MDDIRDPRKSDLERPSHPAVAEDLPEPFGGRRGVSVAVCAADHWWWWWSGGWCWRHHRTSTTARHQPNHEAGSTTQLDARHNAKDRVCNASS